MRKLVFVDAMALIAKGNKRSDFSFNTELDLHYDYA